MLVVKKASLSIIKDLIFSDIVRVFLSASFIVFSLDSNMDMQFKISLEVTLHEYEFT